MGPFPHIPKDAPNPDAGAFVGAILGHRKADRPPMVEYIVDPMVMRPVLVDFLGLEWVDPVPGDLRSWELHLDGLIQFWYRMGYDFVRLEIGMGFATKQVRGEDPGTQRPRGWVDQHHGTIETWDDLERYPWPRADQTDISPLEYIATHLPEGMGFITCHGGGPYEHLSAIMSYEGLCLAIHDQPDLVRAVADRIGQCMADYYDRLLALPNLICVFQGDDMGFRSGTLLSPDQLREYTLPWQSRLARKVHDAGKPYFLHSCGNLAGIMEDLIGDVGIDAKHSFEDAIMPVTDFQARYGSRIGVLGGVDVDKLTSLAPDDLRTYVRGIIDTCGPRGRYAVGSGNSIPSYVPVGNYLTMVDEAQR